MSYEVILLAAGQGRRMEASRNKILLHLLGKPIITYSLATFLSDPMCHHIILVAQGDEQELMQNLITKYFRREHCPITIVAGGSERQYSVYQGLSAMQDESSVVFVHDGARPFVTKQQLKSLYQKVKTARAAVLGVPVKDTIKRVIQQKVVETIPRDSLWQIQTPQVFIGKELIAAHRMAQQEKILATDDAALIEMYGDYPVEMVLGSYENIKLTTPDDMFVGEAILNRRKKNHTKKWGKS